ncbi:hypothetical protein HC766_06095 [Candidatus Gracilibacteria bacterium]|nr:hypothetical protein [Candidatus Gracilibacteria bacterium]NJS41857.1 hypothetical protein [Candidatus Gracilibacteria bacterium]
MSNNLIQLSTGNEFVLESINDGLVVIFSGDLNSDLLEQQIKEYQKNKNLLADLNCSLFFVTNKTEKTEIDNIILDNDFVCYALSPQLRDMNEICESIIFLKKTGAKIEHVYTRLRPKAKYDWMSEVIEFCKNYSNKKSFDNKWKFGQVVLVSGEYLCTNCGYIMDMNQNQLFPVCEVCLSGAPRGACSVREAFWKKLD